MSEYTQEFDNKKAILKDGEEMDLEEIFLELKKLEREDCDKCNGVGTTWKAGAMGPSRCQTCNGVGTFRV